MATRAENLSQVEEPEAGSAVEHLLASGRLSEEDLIRARSAQSAHDEKLEFILTKLGIVSERDVAQAFAEVFHLSTLEKTGYPEEALLLDQISPAFLRHARAIPVEESGDSLLVAMADPSDAFTSQALSFMAKRPIQICVGLAGEIDEAIVRLYPDSSGDDSESTSIDQAAPGALDDVERLRDLASEAPVIHLVDRLIRGAVEAGASDIHIEPLERGLRVRYRIDGVLRTVEEPSGEWRSAIVSRVKILSRLNIAERRLPQDGRLHLSVGGREIDFRVSTAPTVHGESVVLRILDQEAVSFNFEGLGFDDGAQKILHDFLAKPHGIVLVTGPTGSGKTTTLYAALDLLNAPEKKILTVEDPVEYGLEGINQVQVQPGIGRDFAGTLRSFLRQDPDIIMVGEIRDGETARIAIQAALTGHLVLSTVHTNDAASAVARLLDMGVEDYLIASTLVGVIGQRLVRRLCPHCRQAALPSLAIVNKLRPLIEGQNEKPQFYRPVGCDACGHTGYAGRAAIVEILPVTEKIRARILERASASQISDVAKSEGMGTLYADGIVKAAAGVTSLEEVFRVTSDT